MDRKECEKLPGRLRDLCNGNVDLPPYKINAYRKSWGLEPLDLSEREQQSVSKLISTIRKVNPRKRSSVKQKPIKLKPIPKPRLDKGPGTELSKILSSFGIKPKTGCSCNLLISTMDSLGPAGCRQNKQKLLGLMRKNQDKYGWGTYLRAGFNAVRSGWVFKLNPLDPLPQLFDEAVRLAEQNQ